MIVDGNPVYNAPANLKLDQNRMFKTKLRVHLSQHRDETSELCHWHIPETHFLEAWSDTRTYDGTVTIVQPLIEPLYQNKSAHELLAVFTAKYDQKPYDIIREYWQGASKQQTANKQTADSRRQTAVGRQLVLSRGSATASTDFESWWRKCVHDGFVPKPHCQRRVFQHQRRRVWPGPMRAGAIPALRGFELVFRAHPCVYDGRFANNAWLQELPNPLTKITWDNAALVSPNTAQQLGLNKTIGEKAARLG